MGNSQKEFTTILAIDVEKLNIPLQDFLKEIEKENKERRLAYLKHEIKETEGNNAKRILIKSISLHYDAILCGFAAKYSDIENWETIKIWGI
ncbi:hypothetical protein [Candidatus Ulvibacter alkanivorans]|uniref:hypothetical protein n=1 Tax=Candidatus Ulvibacter alkanivorans TaxID=2267620 RepID=UPI000DF13FD4|nr:hypothetical protein [Candidatus Ulvibacter alkanivorans]